MKTIGELEAMRDELYGFLGVRELVEEDKRRAMEEFILSVHEVLDSGDPVFVYC